jgi:hypothetical protein
VSDTDTYFQFPLCALAFCDTETARLDHIISFGFIEAGVAMYKKLDSEIRSQKAETFASDSATPNDYKRNNWQHVAAMVGANEIGITIGGSLVYSMNRWIELSEFRNQFQTRHGNDVLVRIRKGLVFEARDNEGISYRELSILSAVYSCIGAAKYARITKEAIQARMLGYKSTKVLKAEIKSRKDTAQPLTPRQIGYTLDSLDERKFFARVRPNERQTYFSHRLTKEQLQEELFQRKTAKARFHAARKTDNNTLMERIKSERERLAKKTAVKPAS